MIIMPAWTCSLYSSCRAWKGRQLNLHGNLIKHGFFLEACGSARLPFSEPSCLELLLCGKDVKRAPDRHFNDRSGALSLREAGGRGGKALL